MHAFKFIIAIFLIAFIVGFAVVSFIDVPIERQQMEISIQTTQEGGK